MSQTRKRVIEIKTKDEIYCSSLCNNFIHGICKPDWHNSILLDKTDKGYYRTFKCKVEELKEN